MDSLQKAVIPQSVNLIISCDGNASEEVVSYVKSIKWPHGSFNVHEHEKQLGVDAHNWSCIEMAVSHGNVLILEDDLVVAPHFISYVDQVYHALSQDKEIAGIALYRHHFIETNHFPFELIPNSEFLYYQQRSCSNGCFYTAEMASSLLSFKQKFSGDFDNFHLPKNVIKWGDEVFEKTIYAYLQATNKFIAFPRHSLTTDFADMGVHMQKQTNKYVHQSALFLGSEFQQLKQRTKSDNVFDAFYELLPSVVKRFNSSLANFDLEMDIYGHKDLLKVDADYLLSSKKCGSSQIGWERRLKPELNNILMDQRGTHYSLSKKESFDPSKTLEDLKEDFLYYFPDTKFTDLVKMKWKEILSRYS